MGAITPETAEQGHAFYTHLRGIGGRKRFALTFAMRLQLGVSGRADGGPQHPAGGAESTPEAWDGPQLGGGAHGATPGLLPD